jgi:GNAT superfamily N-acetyltransferase
MDPMRLENHWLACMASAGGGGRTTRLPGAVAVANPQVAATAFSFIALRAVRADSLADTLDMGAALLSAEGRVPVVYLSPLAGDVAHLALRLKELGWKQAARQVVLARPLPLAAPPDQADVLVEQCSPGDLGLWGRILAEAYEVEPIAGEAIARGYTALHNSQGAGSQAHFYLARVEGQLAGTGLTWLHGGLAGLYCGAVLPALRRRGVERATLVRRLADAAAAGCSAAFLQTEAGSPVEHLCLQRLGFALAYERTLWVPYGASPSRL